MLVFTKIVFLEEVMCRVVFKLDLLESVGFKDRYERSIDLLMSQQSYFDGLMLFSCHGQKGPTLVTVLKHFITKFQVILQLGI